MRRHWKLGCCFLTAAALALPAFGQNQNDRYDDSSSSSNQSRSGSSFDDDDSSFSNRRSTQSRSSSQSRSSNQSDDYSDSDRSDRSLNRSGRSSSEFSDRSDRSDRGMYSDRNSRSTNRSAQSRSSNQRSDSDWGTGDWTNWGSEKSIREEGVFRASELMGMNVKNGQGEDLGEIEDVVIDLNNHQLRYAAIGYGGLLGVGQKTFAVPLDALQVQSDRDGNRYVIFNAEQEDLDNAEGITGDRWPAQADSRWSRRGGSRSQIARSGSQAGQQSSRQSGQSQAFRATFSEYDDDNDRLVVHDQNGRRLTYQVSPSVRVTQDGQRTFLDELNEGDQLRITYNQRGEEGRTLITAVDVTSSEDDSQSSLASSDRSSRSSYRSGSYDARQGQSQSQSGQSQMSQSRSSQNQSRTLTGQVQDVQGDEIAIRTSDGQTRWISVSDNAQIQLDGDEASDVSELEPGQQVTVRIQNEDGEWTAQSISAQSRGARRR